MKNLLILMKYNIKYISNQILYSYKHLGFEETNFNGIKNKSKKFLWKILLTIYFFWFSIMSLSQVFFNTLNLQVQEINFFILTFSILSLLLFLGYRVNQDFNKYFRSGSFSNFISYTLILSNELLGAIVIFALIFIGALPFLIFQPILNGLKGLIFMMKFFTFIFCFGTLLVFLKIIFDFSTTTTVSYFKNFLSQLFVLLFCIIIIWYKDAIESMIKKLPEIIIENKAASIVMNFVPDGISLYNFSPSILIITIIFGGLLFLFLIVKQVLKKALRAQHETLYKFKSQKTFHPYCLLLRNFNREYKIFNLDFLLVYSFVAIITFVFNFSDTTIINNTSILTSALFVQFLVLKSEKIMSMFYYFNFGVLKTTLLLSPITLIQFFALSVMFSFLFGLESYKYSINFFLLGILNTVACFIIGIHVYFYFSRILQGKVLKQFVKFSILGYSILNLGLIGILIRGLGNYILVPYFSTILLAIIIWFLALKNIKKLRVFLYGLYKKISPTA